MKKNLKKYWWLIAALLLVILAGYRIFNSKKVISIQKTSAVATVDLLNLNDQKAGFMDALCSVEAVTDIALVPETGGKVTRVRAKEGQVLKTGQVIFELENIQQRVAVQNARVSLSSARLALSELQSKTGANGSLLKNTQRAQETAIAGAKNRYLNTDLRAYPEENDEKSAAPVISGNYNCDKEGVYNIRVYGSSSASGASFELSGLESDRESVTTDYSSPLGSCGLEITFPRGFSKNLNWVIPVPNTRSGQHFASKNAYQSALSGKDIALENTAASPQQIAQANARVKQASLQLQAAQNTLSKTYIKAPKSGTLSDFDLSVGDFVSAFSPQGFVKSENDLKLVTYVPADQKEFFVPGSRVSFGEDFGTISSIAAVSDVVTKKNKLVILPESQDGLIEGSDVACTLERTPKQNIDTVDGSLMIPLSAVSVVGTDYYVFSPDKENRAVGRKITPGALVGDDIVVYGLDDGISIVRDARGIREGLELISKK